MNAPSPPPETPPSPKARPFAPSSGQSAFYFLSSLFAAAFLATIVSGVSLSSHEGSSGLASVISLGATYPFCLFALWIAYFWFSKSAIRMDVALFGSGVLALGGLLTCGSIF